jgi:acylphosphatase
MADLVCCLVRVEGRVQGAGFREACVDRAWSLQVAGWVRNRLDGSVEALLQGPSDSLTRMQAWLERGPPAARVLRVQATRQPLPTPPLAGFERRPTA